MREWEQGGVGQIRREDRTKGEREVKIRKFEHQVKALTPSIFLPVYNEEKHIEGVLRGLFEQDWAGSLEILLVDGNSSDSTIEKIQRMAAAAPETCSIRILPNPQRHIPVALNIACREAKGEVLIRLDGHTYPPHDFISRVMADLETTRYAGIIGGRWNILPGGETVCARACAHAVCHPFGIGNAAYRVLKNGHGSALIKVDTVPFGAFKKNLWESLGGYDENLLFDEDSDFNFRARQSGYGIWLDPELVFDYVARPDLKSLCTQYFRYGFWVSRFFLKHKTLPSWRKLVPMTFITSSLLLLLLKPIIGLGLIAFHLSVANLIALRETLRKKQGLSFAFYLTAAFAILHWAYGLGNIAGLITGGRQLFTQRPTPNASNLNKESQNEAVG